MLSNTHVTEDQLRMEIRAEHFFFFWYNVCNISYCSIFFTAHFMGGVAVSSLCYS